MSQGWIVFVVNIYFFVGYSIHHLKSSIFKQVHHVTNERCISLTVCDEPCMSVLDRFEFVDFAFIACVSEGKIAHLSAGLIRDVHVCSFTELDLMLRFQHMQPSVLLAFAKTLFTWPCFNEVRVTQSLVSCNVL